MNPVQLFSACALVLLSSFVAGCLSAELKDIHVEAEANPKVNLDGYQTYAWVAAAAVLWDPDRKWTPSDLDIGAEVVHLVNSQLRAAGKVEVVEAPDLLVAFGVGVDMKAMGLIESSEGDEAYHFEQIPKGGLLIVIFDPRAGHAVWVGAADADVIEKPTADLVKRRLDYAIGQMFRRAPL